mgnify:CR=1 FL=1
MRYALTHAAVFDAVHAEELRRDCTVLTDGETIAAVQDAGQPIPEGFEALDLTGKTLVPGLVNLHAHLFGTGKPSKTLGGGGAQRALVGFIHTAAGRPVVDSMVRHHVLQSLNSGVTTIRSSGDFCYSDVRVRDAINAGKYPGPRLLVPGPAITCVGGHGDGTFAEVSDDPAALAAYVDVRKSNRVDYIKICVTGGVMDAKVRGEPGVVKMTPEQTKAVCGRAHALGFRVASHTESSAGIRVALEGGVDTVEHGSFLDDELVALFKARGSAFIVTISPALPLAKLPASITQLNELCLYNSGVVLDGMISGAKRALAEGLPVGLGTDESCPLVTPYAMWREVYFFVKYCGVSPGFALQTATLKNARIAGIGDVTGSIEPGKSADLVAVDGDPLDDLRTLETPRLVMARGNLLRNPQVRRNPQIDAWLDSLM